jgi:hypothetical protein
MTSIIKVDTIQTSAGGTPTASSLGIGGVGKLGQVIQAVKTDTTTINSQTFTTISGLSLNITPTATSSKILLMMSVTGAGDMSAFRFLRDSTPIGIGDSAGSRPQVTASSPFTNDNKMFEIGMNFLDSPNSTSQLTFVVQSRNLNSGNNAKIGQSVTDTDNNQHPRTISTLTAMEVLA